MEEHENELCFCGPGRVVHLVLRGTRLALCGWTVPIRYAITDRCPRDKPICQKCARSDLASPYHDKMDWREDVDG
jgi:hypothetical protein